MINKIKELIIKYKELIVYAIFGVLTTAVNLVVFAALNALVGEEKYLVTNVIAWCAAVIFAFVTNKIWVFESKSWEPKVIAKEGTSFVAARVFSFLVEEAGLFVFVDLLSFNEFSLKILSFEIGGELIAKVLLAVVVVIMNYILSKLVIFKKKK